MKNKENSKRNIIQWVAFVIVILTPVTRVILEVAGIAQNLAYSTLTTLTWTGFTIGIVLILASYLFPKKTNNAR
ncbi:hypothetical protein D3H55_23540 [Bacillus salacetis]|uniref:Uncharacterized protein n=1 Tax=Bacillus salacetis TaxID=2315464 RepID=A0A3A1QKX9_9BACI|nr:hypothetical protein [Bacillus salacetis]RIW26639.1 hypothetical protein D3H55_23540 [Bacillus salacetis]